METLISYVVSNLVPLVLLVIAYAVNAFMRKMREKTGNESVISVFKIIEEITGAIVANLEQTTVQQFRDDEGKLNTARAREVKLTAIEQIENVLKSTGISVTRDYIAGKIEQAVSGLKSNPIRADT